MKSTLLVKSDKITAAVKFMAWWQIVLFAIIVIAALCLLFPKAQLLKQVLTQDEPEEITLDYLERLLREYPNNPELTIAIIQQEIGLEKLSKAENDINRLAQNQVLSGTISDWDIRWLQYLVMRARAYQLPRDSLQRQTDFDHLAQVMEILARAPISNEHLNQLAQDAISLGKPNIAVIAYKRLIDTDQLNTSDSLAHAAKVALSTSNYPVAAEFYSAAAKKSDDVALQRQYYTQALKALQAGNLLNEALKLAGTLPDAVINDRSLLLYLSELALAANRPEIAEEFIKKSLSLSAREVQQ